MANTQSRAAWLMALGLVVSASAQAAPPASDGSMLLRMCKAAGKVEALGVMCHSYLNGYLEAVHQYAPSRYCLGEHDREHIPDDLSKWIEAHPASKTEAAGKALDGFLNETFSCRKGRK